MMITYGKDREGHCEGDQGDVRARDGVWATWIRLFQFCCSFFCFRILKYMWHKVPNLADSGFLNFDSLIPLNWREVSSWSFSTPPNEAIPKSIFFSLYFFARPNQGRYMGGLCVNQDKAAKALSRAQVLPGWYIGGVLQKTLAHCVTDVFRHTGYCRFPVSGHCLYSNFIFKGFCRYPVLRNFLYSVTISALFGAI